MLMDLFLLVFVGVSLLSMYRYYYFFTPYINFFLNSQTSVSAGKILRMGKGFTIEGVEGYDLSNLFLEAFQRKVNIAQAE